MTLCAYSAYPENGFRFHETFILCFLITSCYFVFRFGIAKSAFIDVLVRYYCNVSMLNPTYCVLQLNVLYYSLVNVSMLYIYFAFTCAWVVSAERVFNRRVFVFVQIQYSQLAYISIPIG